jgi:hypothetical protein
MIRLSQIKRLIVSVRAEDYVVFGFWLPIMCIFGTILVIHVLTMNEDFVQSHPWLGQFFSDLFSGFFEFMFAGLILLLVKTVIENSESNVN